MILVYEEEEQEESDPCRVSARCRGDDRSLDLGCHLHSACGKSPEEKMASLAASGNLRTHVCVIAKDSG